MMRSRETASNSTMTVTDRRTDRQTDRQTDSCMTSHSGDRQTFKHDSLRQNEQEL